MAIEARQKIRSWKFEVLFETTNGMAIIGCNSVPDLKTSIEEREINSGKSNRMTGYADSINLSKFSIERGKDGNQYLYNWFCLSREVARTNGSVLARDYEDKYDGTYKRQIIVRCPNSEVGPWQGLRAVGIGCRPVSYSLSDLDAEDSSILFETVEFKCKRIHFDKRGVADTRT
jgi:hypothetical protein